MKNKGFTLIELLAVIILIGLIAVIILPKVTSTVDDSKKKIAEASALSYARKVDQYILQSDINKEKIKLNGNYGINSNGNLYKGTEEYEIEITGEKPKEGILTYVNNELQRACIEINKYAVTIQNDEVTNVQKGKCEVILSASQLTYTTEQNSNITNVEQALDDLYERLGN